jgi:hypothetical protein
VLVAFGITAAAQRGAEGMHGTPVLLGATAATALLASAWGRPWLLGGGVITGVAMAVLRLRLVKLAQFAGTDDAPASIALGRRARLLDGLLHALPPALILVLAPDARVLAHFEHVYGDPNQRIAHALALAGATFLATMLPSVLARPNRRSAPSLAAAGLGVIVLITTTLWLVEGEGAMVLAFGATLAAWVAVRTLERRSEGESGPGACKSAARTWLSRYRSPAREAARAALTFVAVALLVALASAA